MYLIYIEIIIYCIRISSIYLNSSLHLFRLFIIETLISASNFIPAFIIKIKILKFQVIKLINIWGVNLIQWSLLVAEIITVSESQLLRIQKQISFTIALNFASSECHIFIFPFFAVIFALKITRWVTFEF